MSPNASSAGAFKIGAELEVTRLGYGAMRITGEGIWGPPKDVATKGGFTRHGPNIWAAVGRPEYLRQCCLMSLRRLRVETIELWQLHRIDPKVQREEQFGVMKELQDEGKIRHLGLSEVSVEDIEAARQVFEVATVQNLYNLANRQSEEVVNYCE